MNRVMTIIR